MQHVGATLHLATAVFGPLILDIPVVLAPYFDDVRTHGMQRVDRIVGRTALDHGECIAVQFDTRGHHLPEVDGCLVVVRAVMKDEIERMILRQLPDTVLSPIDHQRQ